MIEDLLTIVPVVFGYLVVALCLSRTFYGQWRAAEIDRIEKEYSFEDTVAYFDNKPHGDLMFGAFITAMVWPISCPIITTKRLVSSFMLTTDVQSNLEIKQERDAMTRRITELEKEMGMRDTK